MALERSPKNDQGRSKPLILVICDYYLPGFESGGAMRTLVNMVDRLSDEFDFKIITRDHDGPLNPQPYTEVSIGQWNRVGNADVYYLSKDNVRPGRVKQLIETTRPDAIYVNSFFSPLTIMVLGLRRFGRLGKLPVILAPEGEFSEGALELKKTKKQLYISTAKLLDLCGGIVWKAAAEAERGDIERVLGDGREIYIAPNMPPLAMFPEFHAGLKPTKSAGAVKMIFLSRFMRKKNFNWLFDPLASVKGVLEIDIYGPLEEADYWEEAVRLREKLPEGVTIDAKGPVSHDKVSETLAAYHFFLLPTLGENFGHVFIEALAAGCPIVTSDRTPWRDLEKSEVGWDLALEDPSKWVEALNRCVSMDGDEYHAMSSRARQYAVDWLADPALEGSNRAVLRSHRR